MPLTRREKELANIGASVATGCKPCTDFHVNAARRAGASDAEMKRAISDAMAVRDDAREIMERHGLETLGASRSSPRRPHPEATIRITELVCIAAAFAVNCTTNVTRHVAAARALGVQDDEIESILDAALFIKGEAAHYVGQIVKLRQEKGELQRLLDELERTQAQLVQSEKMAALGRLVAGLVHEVNTPIGVLESAADTLNRAAARIAAELDGGASLDAKGSGRQLRRSLEAVREGGPTAQAAAERIRRIFAALRSFAHLDGAPRRPTDLHQGLEDTLALLEHDIPDGIRICREYGEIPKVTCDRGEVNQVFMNLLTNAIAAIDAEGTITIETSATGDEVSVRITDTGVGIPEVTRETLFEPAFAATGGRVKAGLGLFASANIVRKHGGRMDVQSAPGRGSSFTIVLPTRAPEPRAADSTDETSRCSRLR